MNDQEYSQENGETQKSAALFKTHYLPSSVANLSHYSRKKEPSIDGSQTFMTNSNNTSPRKQRFLNVTANKDLDINNFVRYLLIH